MIKRSEEKPDLREIEEETIRCLKPEIKFLSTEVRKGSLRKTPERMRSRSGRIIKYEQQREAVTTEEIMLKFREEIQNTLKKGENMRSLKNRICKEVGGNLIREIAIKVLSQVFEFFRERPMTDSEILEAEKRIKTTHQQHVSRARSP